MSNGDVRKTHIKRVYQNDDPNSVTWVDVERIDELTVIVAGRQKVTYKFDWSRADTEGTRTFYKKKISEPGDSTNTIDVPIRYSARLPGFGRLYNHYFLNDETNQRRYTHSRRIYHHDLNLDNPPKDPEEYKSALGRQDPYQYIDVEVIDAYWVTGNLFKDLYSKAPRTFRGVTDATKAVNGQVRKWVGTTNDPLLKDPMVEGDVPGGIPPFQPVNNPDYGVIDPPWRIDPLQNIVNINWGGLAVIFGPQDQNAPLPQAQALAEGQA